MKSKRLIALLLAVLMAAGIFAVSASAYNLKFSKYEGNSTFTPVSVSNHKAVSAVTLYGNADYICMKAKSDSDTDVFVLELFSDSGCKKRIMNYESNFTCDKTTYTDIAFSLVGLKSGTYYAKSHVEKSLFSSYYSNNKETDPSTVVKFKVSIKRGGTTVKNMNTVMYGYENTANGPKLYWFSVPGAKGYYLYRYDSGKYVKIATVKAGSGNYASYVDKAYKNTNGSKTYKVAAYDGSGTTAMSINYCQALLLKTPVVKASVAGDNWIEISWNSCGSDVDYTVFRRTKDSDWEKIETTKDCWYAEEFPSENTLYYYTVVASDSESVSGYNENGVPVLTLSAPKMEACTYTETGINVQWDAVNGANKYRVYRKTSLKDSWTRIGEVTSTSFCDQNVQKDGRYYYTVQSAYNDFVGSFSKDGIGGAFIGVPVLNEITTDQKGHPIISWNAVPGAAYYYVYRKTAGGDWSEIDWGTDLKHIDSSCNLEPAETYTYTVRAQWYNVTGGCDETGKTIQYFPAISNLCLGYTAGSDPNAIGLLWQDSPVAEKYNVYRKTADTDYKLIAQTDTASFSDATTEEGVKYTYKVAYTYKGAEITSTGTEIAAEKSADSKRIVDKPYTAYAYVGSGNKPTGDASYSVDVENGAKDSTYWAFRKVDGKWCYVGGGYDDAVLRNANLTDPSEEFAVIEITADGKISKLPETGTIFYFNTTVTNLASSVNQKEHTLSLTWDAVENCDGYAIYKDGRFVETTKETQYNETGIGTIGNHTYTVCVIKGNDTLAGKDCGVLYAGALTLKAENSFDGVQITLIHDTMPCATYAIYRRTEGATEWTKIMTLSDSWDKWVDRDAKSGVTYYYAASIEYYNIECKHDEVGVMGCYLQTPYPCVSNAAKGVLVSWDAIDGATSYVVYRRSGSSSWQVIATPGSGTTSYLDTTAISGKNYIYTVRAVNSIVRSEYYGVKGIILFLSTPKLYSAKTSSGGITVNFSPVNGAEGYIVYRKTAGQSWSRIANLKSGSAKSYLDKSAKKGVKYTYTVRAYYGNTQSYYDVNGVSAKI